MSRTQANDSDTVVKSKQKLLLMGFSTRVDSPIYRQTIKRQGSVQYRQYWAGGPEAGKLIQKGEGFGVGQVHRGSVHGQARRSGR